MDIYSRAGIPTISWSGSEEKKREDRAGVFMRKASLRRARDRASIPKILGLPQGLPAGSRGAGIGGIPGQVYVYL